MAAEAMEVLGGNGYVEESVMPRIYREMPLNSIWEGAGNIMCLDVLRAVARAPRMEEIYFAELEKARGGDERLDRCIDKLRSDWSVMTTSESMARRFAATIAVALQAALLVRHAPAVVADAFCASRIDGDSGGTFGALSNNVDCVAIVSRAAPVLVGGE